MKQDFDKTIELVETLLSLEEDIQNAREEESAGGKKVVFTETTGIVVRNAVPVIKAISNISEVVEEIEDTDPDEAASATEIIVEHFGGTEEVSEAIKKITSGTALQLHGVKELIRIKKGL